MRPLNSADFRALVPRGQLAEPLHCTLCPLILSTVGRGGGQQHSDQVLACVALLGAGLHVHIEHQVNVGLIEVALTRVEYSLPVPFHGLPVKGPRDVLIVHV